MKEEYASSYEEDLEILGKPIELDKAKIEKNDMLAAQRQRNRSGREARKFVHSTLSI